MKDEPKSPQYTRTWVVAAVCFVIALATIFAERVLHKLGKFDFSSSMQLPTLPLDAVASQLAFGWEAQDGPRGTPNVHHGAYSHRTGSQGGACFLLQPKRLHLEIWLLGKRKEGTPTYIS
ncbi:hypothetical protein NC653_009309 [Populus alba x Populus x berolinensis]|uniref:Uncharacterized protein n=1 Tax=Populus alba x Populus x berolinensis TaxID=444605 RepID=A0AAD6R8V0_9ROSI|nr:hypothetical protein NC653_009309 [Populus alba x Populus x berolinensis]